MINPPWVIDTPKKDPRGTYLQHGRLVSSYCANSKGVILSSSVTFRHSSQGRTALESKCPDGKGRKPPPPLPILPDFNLDSPSLSYPSPSAARIIFRELQFPLLLSPGGRVVNCRKSTQRK